MDSLIRFGERVREAVSPKPKPKPKTMDEDTQKALDKAIGPRFRNTVKKPPVPPPKVEEKKPVPKRRKAPSKY